MTESFAYRKCNHIQLIISLVCLFINGCSCLRRQTTFGDATTGFPTKWRLRNEHRNSILMTHHYPDLGSASDWLNQISHAVDQSDLSSDASSVWNSCTRFSNVIWGGGEPVVVSPNVVGRSLPRRERPLLAGKNGRCISHFTILLCT